MRRTAITMLAGILVLTLWASGVRSAEIPMGTAFTYQGRLIDDGSPANGTYDFRFVLCGSDFCFGPPIVKEDVEVTAGLFTVVVDFGGDPEHFNGEARWLEVHVRPGDSTGDFTVLDPMQELTPTPYALNADTLDGLQADSFTQIRAQGMVAAGNTVTLTIPHYRSWTLELSSGWPHWGGVCFVHGFENDRNVAVTSIQYNGNGTSAVSGAACHESTSTPLVTFGWGSFIYSVQCPGEASGDHNITLTAAGAGVELVYRLIY